MKCVVVGGGVIGTSIAWHAAERGLGEVVLLERDRLGSGTTWHSAGNITWKPLSNHDESVLYALETIDRLERSGRQSTGWVKTGRIFLAQSDEMLRYFASLDAAAQERGVEARWLGPQEAAARHPLLDPTAVSGIWFDSLSGRVNPADLTAAYAKAARDSGVRIVERAKVQRVVTRGGRIIGVELADGVIEADAVVVAAGLWSRPLLERSGAAVAQWPCEHFYVIASVSPSLKRETPSFVCPDALIYGREEVGGFLVGFFDENAKTIEPEDLPEPFSFTLLPPDWDKVAPYFAAASRIFPALEAAPIRRFINGPEVYTPDGLPLIGRIPESEGLFLATGMNSAGVTWSAMAGEIVGSLLAAKPSRFEIARFDPNRFGAQASEPAWLRAQISAIVSMSYRNPRR
ncbi:MAG TPA: FAD-binding oxidoreductase [Stellaceae bacterium]|nr:FAD-binding oxidoreductase [Stellaceae bacterium]